MWPHQGVVIFTVMAAIPPLIALARLNVPALAGSLLIGVLVWGLASYSYSVPIAIVLLIVSFGMACRGWRLTGDAGLWSRSVILYALFFAMTGYALKLSLTHNYLPPAILAEALASPLMDRDRPMTAALNARFPEGTDEAVLRASLLKEGFTDVAQPRPLCRIPEWPPGSGRWYGACPANSREMTYKYERIPSFCGSTRISVNWSVDPAGKVVRLESTEDTPCF
jgi:hypothetical protein